MDSKLYECVSKYDVVSFDIFDTLLKRNVLRPEDVFDLVEDRYNHLHENKIHNFKRQRLDAYNKARKNRTVFDIDYIYSFLNNVGIDYNEIKKIELATEIDISIGNRDIIDVLKSLKSMGKMILIISDMYLTSEIIIEMLVKAGISSDLYDGIYISCDCGCEKNKGALYRKVKEEKLLDGKKWIHVGDNWKSDAISAVLSGVAFYHIPTNINNLEYLNPFKEKISGVAQSISLALANNLVGASTSDFEQIGIETMGPFMLGFMIWLHKQIESNDIKKVFFLARDGKIMMEYFNTLFPEKQIDIKYMYASRRSIIIPVYWTNCTYEFVCNSMSQPAHMTIGEFFYRLNLDISQYEEILKKYSIDSSYSFSGINMLSNNTIKAIFEDVKKDVYCKSKDEYTNLEKYFKQIDFSGDKVAIVDVGWNGGMQKAIEGLPYIKDNNISVYGYYLGINSQQLGVNFEHADGFIYNKEKNTEYRYFIYGFAGPLEMNFFANHGTVIKFVEDDNGIISPVLAENEYIKNGKKTKELVAAEEVQQGVLKYLELIKNIKVWEDEEINPLNAFRIFFKFATEPKLKHLKMYEGYGAVDLSSKQVFIGKEYRKIFGKYSILNGLKISTWKIGFMKYLFRLPLPYKDIYLWMRKRR